MRDGWIETSLGEIAEVIGGGTPSTAISEYWDGNIVWLTPTEITSQDGKVVSDSIRKITELGFKNSGAQMLPIDSVILTSRASVGYVALAGKDLCTNQGFQSLVPKQSVLSKFLMFWIQQNRPEFESRSAGSTFKEISKSNVKSIKLHLPTLPEQKRIVDLISSVDSYIEALKQNLENVKRSRNALLHELFNGGGEDWVETPIGDVAQVLSGFAFKSELFNKSEGIPLIRIRDLPKKDSTEALYSGSYEDRYVVKKGDFLIGMDGEFHCYEWSGPDALLNQRVCRIQDFKISRVLPRYIYFAVNQYLDKIEQDTGYTTVKHISAKQVLGITIPLPPLPEQKRIVEIINTIDEVISQTELTTNKTQSLRSGLLSDLLSGEHEIPSSYDKVIGAA